MIPAILTEDPQQAVMARWGLIPNWATDPRIGFRMINARSESLTQKPAFRQPFRKSRCVIPASGFYEWQKKGREKIPHHIRVKNDPLFALAGLYDRWRDAEGVPLITVTIVTVPANSLISPIHDRMPAILNPEGTRLWLDLTTDEVEAKNLLIPFSSGAMEAYAVSKLVNDPLQDTPDVVLPREPDPKLFDAGG